MVQTSIIERISQERFQDILNKYSNHIKVSQYGLFRVGLAQRNVYKPELLIKTLIQETPKLVGLQRNGRYAAFFRRKQRYLRIIFAVREKEIEIITFFNIKKLPRV